VRKVNKRGRGTGAASAMASGASEFCALESIWALLVFEMASKFLSRLA
ncbi:unnamed protein product, partial [Acidithrix sp. C25]